MSITTHFCTVESNYLVDFLRLLGRIGVKFDISDECYGIINVNCQREGCYYYRVKIYADKKQWAEFKKTVDILTNCRSRQVD